MGPLIVDTLRAGASVVLDFEGTGLMNVHGRVICPKKLRVLIYSTSWTLTKRSVYVVS
jgi:hypothetical protein